ncbi:MAG: LamG-like jellyroll fold domain-containing protein, partial [Anaerolineae bacterium]|nr:LamG-like jellyroll fold domain-containing protein [Anaerolineae bacterium]
MTTNLERRPRWLRVVLSTLVLIAQALPTTAQAYQPQLTTWDVEHAAPAAATVLPAWFAGAQAADPAVEVLPSWFEGDASQPESPAGFTPLVNASEGSAQLGSQTIFANQVTVTVSPPQISLCDPLTVTVVAANNNVTTTGVLITVTLPGGFTSNSAVFNVGAVAPNAVITRTAVFTATCSAVSGQVVVTLTQDAYPPIIKIAEYVVNPGAITVRKEPAVVPAAVGDVVTWTVIVENTGYGTVYNVRVTDTLGSGLQFVSGITSATYVSIPVGQTVSFTVGAKVVACSNLENSVVATWGCNGETCLTPQTAKAAIDLLPRFPDLDYTLPSFNVNYCAGSTSFTVPITNVGDGTAYSVTLPVNLSPFSVTVAAPATYTAGAFQLPPIPPGQTFNLVFTLTIPSNTCNIQTGGSFGFDITYRDACGFPYAEIPQSASWQLVNTPGSLSVSKAAPSEAYRGMLITTPITVNASGISGTIRVTDRVPSGFTVVSTGGGVSFTLGGVTYITWVVSGTAVLTPVFVVVTGAAGCAACGLALTNLVTATASDCRNCQQTAVAQSTTYIQCDEGVQSLKLVSDPAPVCSNAAFTYTNVFTFPLSFNTPPTWTGLVFTEALTNQTYVTGSAQVFVSDGNVSCTATFSQAVVGGQLVISNINPPCNPNIAGATLIISYTTTPTETDSCSDVTWYDWSYLNLGTGGNSTCSGGDVIAEGVFVQTQAPRMTLSLSGLPSNVASCGVYTVTLTAQRTSSTPAYDAVLEVPTNTYAVLEVVGFGGATPIFTQTGSFGYRWFYSDAFASALTATVQLRVQLRCSSMSAPFSGKVHYESLCTNNDAYFERCSAGNGLAAPARYSPLPLVSKFPELIYATSDFVTWTLVAKNTGAGPAYSVVLTDALGSGLRFVTATITSSLGAVTNVNMITSSNLVTWEVPVIQPKETLTIRYTAEIVSCTDLTNRFAGVQGCLGQVCLSGGPVASVVEIPPTVLLNTNQTFSPIDTCFTRTVTVTVRNAGLLSVYSATVTQTLPNGLFYVPGSTQISTDTVNWAVGPDPTISGQTLSWGPTAAPPLGEWLKRVRPKETVYLRFDVRASCAFEGGQLRIQTGYRDVCGAPHTTASSSYVLGVRQANLSITKIGQNLSRTSPSNTYLYAEPGEIVVFTVTVANASSAAPAQLLVVTDTLPANLVFQSATPGYSGASPGSLGGTITWSLPLLNPGSSAVFTVTTVVSQPQGCQITDTFNAASVSWGCPDGCRLTLPAQQVRIRTRPVFDAPNITPEIAPSALNVCGGLITLTLRNDGPPAYNVVLTNALPSGYVYSDTVSSSTLPSGTTNLGSSVVYTWLVLPSGVTTLTLRVRNANTSGACAVVGGTFSATLLYDDDVPDCPNSGPYTATASLNASAQSPNLIVSKSPSFRIGAVGQTVTWTIRITNTGSGTAFNVRITDVVGSSFVNVTGTNGAVVSGNTLTWTLSALAPNAAFNAVVTAVITAAGDNRNVVTATSRCDTGCVTASGVSTAFVSLSDLFSKGPAVQTGTVGSLTVFTFVVASNDVDNIFTQVQLTDVLPIGLGYVSAALSYTVDLDGDQGGPATVVNLAPTITPGLYASGNVVWNLGVLTGAFRITGTVVAVVQNITQTNDGNVLTNTLVMSFVDNGQPGTLTATARVNTIEPLLHLGKTYLTPYACSGTLLEDNFNRASATPPTGWSNIVATWTNESGLLVRTGGLQTNSILVRANFTATEFSYSAMVSSTDDASSFGLVFRYTPSGHYRLRLRLNDGGTNAQLQEVSGTTTTNLATNSAFTPTLRQWYHLEVQVEEVSNGVQIRAYIDGQLVISHTDTTPRDPGSVGIYTNDCVLRACAFDDLLVTRLNRAGCFVGANDLVTYTLTISNQGRLPGYDLVITDIVPPALSLVTYTLSTNDPSNPTLSYGPPSGASGVLTWAVSHLTPVVPFTSLQHTALTLTVVMAVAPWVTANVTLSNHAFLRYDAWLTDAQPISTIARTYSGGSHAAAVQTANGGIAKQVQFAPPPTATLGTLVTYTLLIPSQPISATLYNVLVTDVLDSRLQIVSVTAQNGFWSWGWSGQVVTASFGFIPANTQALVTITARIPHEYPNAAGDANAGDVITNVARMSHSTAGVTTSNVVSTVIGEPNVLVSKHVESSTGLTTGLDGLAYLTYTIRLTNTGSAPAYSVYVTDTLPAGISVTALFG